MKIIEALTDTDCSFWNSYEDTFVRRDKILFHRYAGSLLLLDISEAMKPGKVCDKITLNWWPHDEIPRGIDELFAAHGFDLRALFNALLALPWEKAKHHRTGEPLDHWQQIDRAALVALLPDFAKNPEALRLDLHRGDRQAIRVWSPFATLNPLPCAPKKWTVAHVVRALMAGQYQSLKCNGVYTDDYAFDAGVNYQQGEIKNGVAFARRIMESPSGWWASERGGVVSICCHHFDSNEFKFDVSRRHPGTEAAPVAPVVPAPPAPLKLEKSAAIENPAAEVVASGSAPRVVFNREKNGVELYFPSKPDADTLAYLKHHGWRWSRFSSCWYARRDGFSVSLAVKLGGLTDAQAVDLFGDKPAATELPREEQPQPSLAELAQRALASSWAVF